MKDYLRAILILLGIYLVIPCLYSFNYTFRNNHQHNHQHNNRIDTFNNPKTQNKRTQNKQTQNKRTQNKQTATNEITIIIPSIYRKDKNYINETLSELYKQKQSATKLNIFIHIGDYQHNSKYEDQNPQNDISFYINDEFKLNPDVTILKTFKDEYGSLLNKYQYDNGKDYMFWRSKQNLDYYFAITKTLSKTNAPYILFLEDDQKAITNWDDEIINTINIMKNNNKICHTKMSSLGMCAYLYNSKHMNQFANYIKHKYNTSPCDWLINEFVKKNSLKITSSPKFIFQHEGNASSLINKKQQLKVKL
jgi:hypothetical protein